MRLVELRGIRVKDYAHPEEIVAFKMLNKAKIVKITLDWISNQNNRYVLKTNILGNCFRITSIDMPALYRVVSDVCSILDYSSVPQIYVYHNALFEIGIYAGQYPLLVIPDFLLNEFDDEMLRFQIGRAITALKSDTCQLKMLANTLLSATSKILIPGITDAAVALIADWSRKEGLTEDRGGLLACQDIYTAERALMRMAGMPLKYLDSSCIIDYIKACQNKSTISAASQYMKTIIRTESWTNDRIANLYQWYISGEYDDIIEEYE